MSRTEASFYTITNKSPESKSVDVMVYGAIPSWDEDTYKMKNTAEKFVKDFKALEKDYDRINIHINSPGGSIYHGFPIFNAIASSTKDVHTYNDGLAASMAGILLLAGKQVHSAKNAILMIHNANAFAIGHAENMRDVANMLDTYDESIAQHFADKANMTIEEVKEKFLNYKDHFLSAEKAKELGFIDVVEDKESAQAPPENIMNMTFEEVYASYRPKMPDPHQEMGLFQRFAAQMKDLFHLNEKPAESEPANQTGVPTMENPPAPPAKPKEPTNQATPQSEDHMDFKNALALLAKDSLSAEDISAIRAEISQFTGANEKFTADEVNARVSAATEPLTTEITALKTEKANLANEVTNLQSEKETLSTEVRNLNLDIQAYRKSGVQIAQSQGREDDAIPGDESADNLLSETDLEVRRLRAEAGLA